MYEHNDQLMLIEAMLMMESAYDDDDQVFERCIDRYFAETEHRCNEPYHTDLYLKDFNSIRTLK
ncbi:hypothetical protein BLOT_003890 [Blomia tropicalis]|nr:hypothetical protein BLOT_003890 [Blomia tropicalis]